MLLTDPPVWQTDGRTDGIAMAYTCYSIYAVARKNSVSQSLTLDFTSINGGFPVAISITVQPRDQMSAYNRLTWILWVQAVARYWHHTLVHRKQLPSPHKSMMDEAGTRLVSNFPVVGITASRFFQCFATVSWVTEIHLARKRPVLLSLEVLF